MSRGGGTHRVSSRAVAAGRAGGHRDAAFDERPFLIGPGLAPDVALGCRAVTDRARLGGDAQAGMVGVLVDMAAGRAGVFHRGALPEGASGLSGRHERARGGRHFGFSRESVKKMPGFPVPPGYRQSAPVRRPKRDGFTGIVDQWPREDLGQRARQRHTAQRVLERLRDEHLLQAATRS